MIRLLAALALTLALVQTAGAKSLALILGNDGYLEIPPLQKARADAAGYAELFGQMGFEVILETDVDAGAMTYALAGFLDRIEPGDTVAFIYSGHGWSDGRQNFLVPVDIRAQGSETLLARESFPLRNGANGIIDEIAARGPRLTLAIIDACRNNPFVTDTGTRALGLSRGLVQVAAPSGTFIAFSAGEGQTALDRLSDNDADANSVFTRSFLRELRKPQDLQSAFKATQLEVNDIALTVGHPQRPAYYDEVIGSACLSGRCDPLPVAAPAPGADPVGQARAEWEDFRNSVSVEALRQFADRHRGTPYAALAEERIAILQPQPPSPPAPRSDPGTAPAAPVPVLAAPVAPPPAVSFARPSWCTGAATPAEVTICSSEALASLDIRLGNGYAKELNRTTDAERAALRDAQRSWLVAREASGENYGCLQTLYDKRISVLMH
jgi:uncharacterized protein YecT (DUF1311 family)